MIPKYVLEPKTDEDRKKSKAWFIINAETIDPSKKTLAFIAPDDDGTCHFRVLEPLRAIARLYPDKYNLVFFQGLSIPESVKPDLVVLHRPETRALPVLGAMREALPKCKFVFDMDDYIKLGKDHPVYYIWESLKLADIAENLLYTSDHVIASTEELKSRFYRYNPNITVIRNGFDWKLPMWNLEQTWLNEKNAEGKLVIGWAGGSSHMNDLIAMSKFLKVIHDRYPHVHFVLGGVPTVDHFVHIVRDEATGKDKHITTEAPNHLKFRVILEDHYKNFDKDRIDFVSSKNLMEYGSTFSMFNINIAYVTNTPFNKCKSEIKILEGLKYGAVPCFTYQGGYKEYFDALSEKDYGMAVLMDSVPAWVRRLSNIIENYDQYKDKAEAMKQNMLESHSIDRRARERVELFESLMK